MIVDGFKRERRKGQGLVVAAPMWAIDNRLSGTDFFGRLPALVIFEFVDNVAFHGHPRDSIAVRGNAMEWLSEESLHESEPAAVYRELCPRLRDAGMPILPGQVGFRILHPLYDASSINWTLERGVAVTTLAPRIACRNSF
jgi:hypothetical protein